MIIGGSRMSRSPFGTLYFFDCHSSNLLKSEDGQSFCFRVCTTIKNEQSTNLAGYSGSGTFCCWPSWTNS